VTELCTGGELFDYIIEQGLFSEQEAANIFRSLVSSLMYCHQHKVIHRKINLQNILIEQKPQPGKIPVLKIIDLGMSAINDH